MDGVFNSKYINKNKKDKRLAPLFDMDIKSDVKCKYCTKSIPLYQMNHYMVNFGIGLSFCR
jgi:hypothetical protein